jgi:predicted transcriptional regulator
MNRIIGREREAMAEKRRYKSWELYTCIALNRLAQELNIDIYQPDIEKALDQTFEDGAGAPSIPKVGISYEIKSNHHMTNKVLDKLQSEGLIQVTKEEREYRIAITKEGVLYLRKFNAFFVSMYRDLIMDHYRYRQIPRWFQEE